MSDKSRIGDLILAEGEARRDEIAELRNDREQCINELARIAEHGRKPGTFAGENMERAAFIVERLRVRCAAAESKIAALKVDLAAQVKRANDLDARLLAECIDFQNEIEKVEAERDEAVRERDENLLLPGDITCFDTANPGCGRCNRCYEYQRDFAKESLELARAEIARVRKERDEARSARDQDYVRLAREIEESREAQIAALADLSQERVMRDEYARMLQKATADFENEARLYCAELKEARAERDNANVAREAEWKRAQGAEAALARALAALQAVECSRLLESDGVTSTWELEQSAMNAVRAILADPTSALAGEAWITAVEYAAALRKWGPQSKAVECRERFLSAFAALCATVDARRSGGK